LRKRKIRQKILSVLLTAIFFLSTVISINVSTANAVTPDDLKDVDELIVKFQKLSTQQVNDALAIGQRIIVQSDSIPEILNPHQKLLLNNLGLTNAQVESAYNSVMSQLNTEEKINDLKSGDLTKLANFINTVEGSFEQDLKDTLVAKGLTASNIIKTVLDVAKLTFDPFDKIPKADLQKILKDDLGIASSTAARYGLNWGNVEKLRKALTAEEITKLENILNTIRDLNDNADLSGLTVSAGSLDPVFAPDTVKYTVIVGSDVNGFTVTPTTADANATVKVEKKLVQSGTASETISFKGNSRKVKVTVTVTAPSGAEKNYTLTVLKPKKEKPKKSDETIDVCADEPVVITVPREVSGAKIKAKDLAGGTATLPFVQAQVATSFGTISLQIPDDTKITGPAGWDGTITLPIVKANDSVSISNGNVSMVVEVGLPDAVQTFDKGVRLLLPGQKGKSAAYQRGNSNPVTITRTISADSQTVADAELPAEGDGKINVGSDLVLWTKHFTQFIAYTPAGGGGGSGGGGGGGGGGTPAVPDVTAISDSDLDAAIEAAGSSGIISLEADSHGKIGFTIAQLDKVALTGKQIEVKASEVTFTLEAEALKAPDLNLTEISVIQIGAAKLDSAAAKEIVDKAVYGGQDNVAGDIFSLDAVAVTEDDTQQDIEKFNGPVKVALPVPASARDAASNGELRAGRFNEEKDAWDIVSGQYDATGGTFTFETDKFSKWALLTPAPPSDLTPKPPVFSDIAGHWAQKDIEFMAAHGYVKGMGDGTFAPDAMVTRAEFATLLVNELQLKNEEAITFLDVPEDAWYYSFVASASAAGLIKGYNDEQFGPEDSITREQMAAMIARALQYQGKQKNTEDTGALMDKFADKDLISGWAAEPVAQVVNQEIIKGRLSADGTLLFAPQDNATRAEATAMLKRLLGLL